MPIRDPEKRREYRRKWYSKNKDSEKDHVKRRKIELQKWFKNYKSKLRCSQCGEDHPSTIDFHHVKGKDANISKLVAEGYSKERIKRELDKCIVLCSNCHRKKHWNPK